MAESLPLTDFLKQPGVMLDVRSPDEFTQGHIPCSLSLPLFSNEERSRIGTAYKKEGKHVAVALGLSFFEKTIDRFLADASPFFGSSGRVLCWRGGMRSGFAARLLEAAGHSMATLQGGYKSYRRWALKKLDSLSNEADRPAFFVIGGLTGSGKTAILNALRSSGGQTIDLEAIAGHRGSVFGGIGLPMQPSQEQFENELAHQLDALDWNRPIWLEDESRLIGKRHLPPSLYLAMQQAPLLLVRQSLDKRLDNLLIQYQNAPTEALVEATSRLVKRIGRERAKEVYHFLEAGNRRLAFEHLLIYYDKTYRHQLSRKGRIVELADNDQPTTPENWATILQHMELKQTP
jgi:tRNA 2-selenouridine synthase